MDIHTGMHLCCSRAGKKQDFFFHGLISHNDKAVPDFHKSTFHCSHMRAFQSLLACSPASFTALFSLILHFILLSSSFLKCQGEHLSSLHHKETQRHLSTRGCVSQMPATFNSQKAAYLQTVYSVWGNTLHKEPFWEPWGIKVTFFNPGKHKALISCFLKIVKCCGSSCVNDIWLVC